ncbi:MAG: sigma-70 family RNA polymerase sigma factor [Bryobacteraceae bacterium]|nr:sigma-70 family RNA polymerase sigma factor [Bryobacteraceae bacterium]
MDASGDVTILLNSWRDGDREALGRLMTIVYEELRTIAHRHIARESSGQTVQATALVHEAFLKFADQRRVNFENRSHFFAVAARIIRRILIDRARHRLSAKRDANLNTPIDLFPQLQAPELHAVDSATLLDLDMALDHLEARYPKIAKLVELRYFAGLTIEETAEILTLSPPTVKRDWLTAKAMLARSIQSGAIAAGPAQP